MTCPHCLDTGLIYHYDDDHEQYSIPEACPFCDSFTMFFGRDDIIEDSR